MVLGLNSRTVHGIVEELASAKADDVFLFFDDESYTYADINNEASRVAAGLQKLGVEKGEAVAIMSSNRPEFLFAWFGLSKLGAVQVPINTAHKGELLHYLLQQSDTVALIIEAAFLERFTGLYSKLPKLKSVIVLDDAGEAASVPVSALAWTKMVRNDGAYAPVEVSGADPAAMMFTSGTTGPSKAAVVPQNYQIVMGETIAKMGGYSPADRLFNALPLFHGNAQTLSTMPALISGASMVLSRRFSASSFWGDVRKHQCTEFNYIGSILSILLKAPASPDDGDNPIRVMIGAGASKSVAEAFEARFNVRLIESYGMSEIGVPLVGSAENRKLGSCGRRNPDYEILLVDDDGVEVGPNTPGELLVRPNRSNAMMLEYYGMPEKTVEAWRDLWFHTGDYLQRDEDGFYYFVDRKKDALRRRGENISSFEVERIIGGHEAVFECAAVAAQSELGEDEVMVCITLQPGASLEPMELVAFCEERMAHFMAPRYIRILDKLPKTPTERVQKFILRQQGVTADTFDRERVAPRGGRRA